MKVAAGNDHTVTELKNVIKESVEEKGYGVIDLGTNSTKSCDYPIYGEKVGRAAADDQADLGVAIRGTNVGIPLATNKVKGIQACVYSEPYIAKLSRVCSNPNVLALGARVVGSESAKTITEVWLDAEFEGDRYECRVNMTMEVENRWDGTRLFQNTPTGPSAPRMKGDTA